MRYGFANGTGRIRNGSAIAATREIETIHIGDNACIDDIDRN